MIQLIAAIFLLFNSFQSYAQITQPQLIVLLVIDQLRGDLIDQHQHQFAKGGFDYLINHSIDYHNTHHPHANTTTCAGHATIATGSFPALHGIISNHWYARELKQEMYCMDDLQSSILKTEHALKGTPGRSPKNLNTSTLSDELILSQKGRAFGVSLKDRSAIILGGHAGKAFWFDKSNGGFISSTYYYDEYPQWVKDWNKHYHPKDYDWNLARPKTEYKNANSPIFSKEAKGLFGSTFPHHIPQAPSHQYFKLLSKTPKADQLTADFAEHLLTSERLGKSPGKTDYLGISFSAVDAIGHQFGPHSLESEDNLLQLDKTLSHLFAHIDSEVGLNNTVIVLTADHGMNDGPVYLKAHHMEVSEPVTIAQIKQSLHQALKTQYHLPEQALLAIVPPFIYLDHKLINPQKLSEVSHYLAEALTLKPGVFKAFAFPITTKDWLSVKVNRMNFPNRAGDIYFVQPPNQSFNAKNNERIAHGSPWQYDSYVPLLFAHPSFTVQRIFRPTSTTDIAATLAAILRIKSPSACVGNPLDEVTLAFEKPPGHTVNNSK